MSVVGINWELADKMYAREEDKICEETQEKQQEAAKVWAQANRFESGARISAMHKIHIETLKALADASIDSDWNIVIRSGCNISESLTGNIITRLNGRLTKHINSFMFSAEQSIKRNSVETPALSSLQKKSNEVKTKLIAKAKRELGIRRELVMIAGLKEKSFQFLNKLHEIVGNDESQGKHAWQIGELLGFDKNLSWEIAQYLDGENLISIKTVSKAERDCYIGITHQGIVKALSEPDKPTEHSTRISQTFGKEHDPSKTVFIMMKFSGDDPTRDNELENLFNTVKLELDKYGFDAARADEKDYSSTTYLWDNIQIYINGCDYGIAVLENLYSDEMNPNVALEYGYMLAKDKKVLLLKEKSFRNIRADILGKLWKEFEFGKDESIKKAIQSWMVDLGITRIKT